MLTTWTTAAILVVITYKLFLNKDNQSKKSFVRISKKLPANKSK